jgi:hypothetical protein
MEFAGVSHLWRASEPGNEPAFIAKLDPLKNDDPPPAKVDPPKDMPLWTILKPIEMKSDGGATLTLQDDGSVLAGGELPAQDVYTLTFRGLPPRIQALRLEVLPHESLPQNGPGRRENGNFVLTTIKAQLDSPTKPGAPHILNFTNAWADYSSGGDSGARLAIDAEDNTGWKTEPGKTHYAVFEPDEPTPATDGKVLRVTLEFKWQGPQFLLGCFRLSVAKDKVPPPDTVSCNDGDRRRIAALPASEQIREFPTINRKAASDFLK